MRAGGNHSCGWTSTDKAYCWGANDEGQIGTGAPKGTLTPRGVSGGLVYEAISVGAVGNHACGVTAAGAGWCWGKNNSGRIVDGTMVDATTPCPCS